MQREIKTGELCKSLGIRPEVVKRWREEGLPFRRNKNCYLFDPQQVSAWLIETGKAQRAESLPKDIGPTFTTRKEVAKFFDVAVRTVAAWLEDPSFPGESGNIAHGKKGNFPAKAIANWLRNTGKQAKIPKELLTADEPEAEQELRATHHERLVGARAARAELELSRLQGGMIDAELVFRENQRQHSYVVTMLRSLPAKLLGNLRSSDEQIRKIVYETAMQTVNDCCETIAELLDGDKDEQQFGEKAKRTRHEL